MTDTLYLHARYLITSQCEMLKSKFELPCDFLVKDVVSNVLGENWIAHEDASFFINRMNRQGKDPCLLNEPVIYGKVIENGEVIMLNDLLLFSEIVINYTLKEYDDLIKSKKIIELEIKN